MSDKHTMSLDYQIAQSRRVKALEAGNGRLRAEIAALRAELERVRGSASIKDGSTIYLLMVNELEQDGHSRDYVRDAFATREDAEAAAAEAIRRYQSRLEKMNAQQRHRHTMEAYSIDEVTLTGLPAPPTKER